MTKKITLLANDGSPLGVTSKTLWGDTHRIGLGGSEYSLITLCEAWTAAGHEVELYNDPWEENASPFAQYPINAFNPNADRDVLIVFRSPNLRSVAVNNCLKVWWSCDQFSVGSFKDFSATVDKIVCISPYHQKYFIDTYGIENTVSIDLPVRVDDYLPFADVMKIKNRVIFTSVPARGLLNLNRIWPRLKAEVPDASLVITADYRLWGSGAGNDQFKAKFIGYDGVQFLGAVPRVRLLEEQKKAELNLYTANYEELFCIAVAENQYAGAYPITSSIGALATTNMGTVLDVNADDPRSDNLFIEHAVNYLNSPDKEKLSWDVRELAYTRFHPERILGEWDNVFNS